MLKLSLLAFIAFCASSAYGAGCPRRVCYHTNWSQYRPGAGKFMPESIDSSLCTHIIYTFAKLQGNHLRAFEWNDESTAWMKGMYTRFQETVRSKNPSVKTLLAVGGWNMGTATFTQMASTQASRSDFATSTVKFLRDHDFDGIDMDWEYPGSRGSPAGDKMKFVELLKELRYVFQQDAQSTGKPSLILTSAVPAGKPKIDAGYDIPAISKLVDFLNLMAYDLHGSWETHTGQNDALYASPSEKGDDRTLNVDWATQYWISKGAPRDKLVLGMGLYGRSFTLKSSSNTGEYAPTRSKGQAGQFTREGGFLSYYEICKMISTGGVVHQEKDQMVPYAVKGTQWVGYDDVASIRQKVRYAKANNLGGVMVWAIDLDDFRGSCGGGAYPLLHALNSECSASGGTLNTPAPQITTARPLNPVATPTSGHGTVSTAAPDNHIHHSHDFLCSGRTDGFYPSPNDCSEYYICAGQTAYKTVCASGLVFNPKTSFCDWPRNYQCTIGGQTFTQAPAHTTRLVTKVTTHAPIIVHTPYPTQAPHHTKAPGSIDMLTYCKNLDDGIHADPTDCKYFFDCANHNTYRIPCAPGTAFHEAISNCDIIANVPNCS